MDNNLSFRRIILLSGDLVILYLCLIITLILVFGQSFSARILAIHLLPFTFIYLIWLFIFLVFDLYELDVFKSGLSFFIRISLALVVCLIIGISFFYILPIFGISPKTNLLILGIIIFPFLLLWRRLFLKLFTSFFKNQVAIVGFNQESEELANAFRRNPHLGYNLVKIIPVKDINYLQQEIPRLKINTLIIAKVLSQAPDLKKSLYNCLNLRINILNIARAYEIIFQKIPVGSLDYLWFLENLKEGQKEFHDKIKRIIDLILGGIIFLLSLPLYPIIMIAIKLDSKGPIFYKQERVGKNRIPFSLFKFRSMEHQAEKHGPVWAQINDPRITKTGRVIRRLHLDEIPQMINILRGDISLVGPRPERPVFVEMLEQKIPHYHLRHLIKPGFTGWAFIKFRYGRTVDDAFEKFQYDLYYIKNRSLILDILIILRTIKFFFKKSV